MAAPRIAAHARPQRKHKMVPYHQGIQRGVRKADGKILVQERHGAPKWSYVSCWRIRKLRTEVGEYSDRAFAHRAREPGLTRGVLQSIAVALGAGVSIPGRIRAKDRIPRRISKGDDGVF
jgi:hypothetical protein